MFGAFLWGLAAASSLVIGEVLASFVRIPRRVVGLIMAFGVGVLMSAVSFELVEEAFQSTHRGWAVAWGLVVGALTFFVGDLLVTRIGGRSHRSEGKPIRDEAGLAIVLGTVLDGIPESIVIGLSLITGGKVGVAMLAAVFISNLPEAVGATSSLKAGGWKRTATLKLWLVVAFISALASLAGFAFFDTATPDVLAFTLAFAGGALLTMMAGSMMPEAFRDSGQWVGLATTLGFGLAYFLTIIT